MNAIFDDKITTQERPNECQACKQVQDNTYHLNPMGLIVAVETCILLPARQ